MSFFNKKEEILEIKLTSYGKDKLAKGKFKPVYYAFFDDDILYDAARAEITEDNNDIEPRIQDNTPSTRVQTSFSDLEKKIKKQRQITNVENLQRDDEVFQDQDGLRNVLPLGNSQLGNQNVAAWRVELLNAVSNTMRSSINNDLDKSPVLNIPQIDMDMTVSPYIVKKDFPGVIDPLTGKFVVENDGNFIRIKDDFILLDISEFNVDLQNDAFSLEVFEITEDENSEQVLTPKMFTKRIEHIVDGILLDEEEVDAQISLAPVDNRFSEYYFDITLDETIEEDLAQSRGGTLYTTDNEGEDC